MCKVLTELNKGSLKKVKVEKETDEKKKKINKINDYYCNPKIDYSMHTE